MPIETQRELLKRVSEQTNLNYTELAKTLGVTRQAVSQFRRGSPISDSLALKIAKISHDEPEYVLAVANYNKAAQADDADKEVLRIFERMAKFYRRQKS